MDGNHTELQAQLQQLEHELEVSRELGMFFLSGWRMCLGLCLHQSGLTAGSISLDDDS